MRTAIKNASRGNIEGIPPRERILAAAADLFYRHGIRAIGVDSIAEAAGTNKMTLYRHFASKDELVAEYLRRLAEKASAAWDRFAADHPGDPRGQLRGWLADMAAHVGSGDERGCPLANAAVELPAIQERGDVAQSPFVARGGQGDPLDMVVEIEVLVLDPVRAVQPHGHGVQLPAEVRDQGGPLDAVAAKVGEIEAGRVAAIEDAEPGDVLVDTARLAGDEHHAFRAELRQ